MKIRFNTYPIAISFACIAALFASCSDDDDNTPEPPKDPIASLYDNKITISDVIGIPDAITFDQVKVLVQGVMWSVIDTIEAPYKDGSAVLALPSSYPTDELMPVDRTDGRTGYWPAYSTNQDALVASMEDEIYAYNGTKIVGRLRLTDWIGGTESSAEKTFINYIYGDSDYVLSGHDNSYIFNKTPFVKGWNAYAKINPYNNDGGEGYISVVTSFDKPDLRWYFVEGRY